MSVMEPAENKAQAERVNPKSSRPAKAGKRQPKRITESYLHNSGLYYLQRFAAGKAHFKSVMMRKVKRSCLFYPEQSLEACRELVDALADKFEASGLLNDEGYLHGAVTSLQRQGRSAKAIRGKLMTKGFRLEKIDQALESLSEFKGKSGSELELDAALRFAQKKKIGRFRLKLTDAKGVQRELSALARAGFSYEISRQIMDREREEPEDADYL